MSPLRAAGSDSGQYVRFIGRVYAILRSPLAQAMELIARETTMDVLTQASDLCHGERRAAIGRRIATLQQHEGAGLCNRCQQQRDGFCDPAPGVTQCGMYIEAPGQALDDGPALAQLSTIKRRYSPRERVLAGQGVEVQS